MLNDEIAMNYECIKKYERRNEILNYIYYSRTSVYLKSDKSILSIIV